MRIEQKQTPRHGDLITVAPYEAERCPTIYTHAELQYEKEAVSIWKKYQMLKMEKSAGAH